MCTIALSRAGKQNRVQKKAETLEVLQWGLLTQIREKTISIPHISLKTHNSTRKNFLNFSHSYYCIEALNIQVNLLNYTNFEKLKLLALLNHKKLIDFKDGLTKFPIHGIRVADPHHLDADPDPSCHFDADPAVVGKSRPSIKTP